MSSGPAHVSLSPEQNRRQQQQQHQQQQDMIEIKEDSDDPAPPKPGSSGSGMGGASGSRPSSSSHRLDTASLGAALPSTHQANGIRSRITVVCAECKRLKLRCDRRTPCGSCMKRDTIHRCQYTPAASEKVDVQSLHNRVLTLESKVTKLSAEGLRASALDDVRPTSLLAVNNGSSVVVSLDDVAGVWLDELEVELEVELKPLGPDVPAELDWAQIFPSPEVFFPSPDVNSVYGIGMELNTPTVTPQLLQKLPDGPLRDAILAQFQNTLAMHPCTNWNDFSQQAQAMFSTLSLQEHEARMSNMYPVPPTPRTAPASLTFFASVAAAFALGAQALAEAKRWGPSQVPYDDTLPNSQALYLKAEEYFSLSQSTLQVAQRTAAYDLDFLMAMRMQCLYLLHDGKPRVAHSVLPEVGKMINIARFMGLHIDPGPLADKYSVFEMEMRRRVWWDIYYLDVFISDYMSLPPLIDDGTFSCNLPTDCDDQQLHPRMSVLPAPTEHSDYTYFILKSRLAQLVKKVRRSPFRDEQNQPDIKAAMALAKEVKDWLDMLPPRFQLAADEAVASSGPPFLVAQRCELASIANQIVLKIYHPFLRRVTLTEPDVPGQAPIASIDAAHQLVFASKILHKVLRHTRPATYMFYSFGRQLFHAAVICAHNVIRGPVSIYRQPALQSLDIAIDIMRDPMLATGRGPARGGAEGSPSEALRIVEALRDKCDAAMRGKLFIGSKRKHGDLDPHLLADFQMPYVGAAVATASEEYEPEPQYNQVTMPYQQGLQYPGAVVQTPMPTAGPSVEQPPTPVQPQPQRVRVHPTHRPPPQDVESPYVPVGPTPDWVYQQKSASGSTGGKDRSRNRPSIGVRRRDTEPNGPASRPRVEGTPSSGSSSQSPIGMRKPSTFGNAPPPTSGVAMPGAAQFQQAQQAQQEFAQQYGPVHPAEMAYYPGTNMYGPPNPHQPQQMFYGQPQEEQPPEAAFQGAVNPQLITGDVNRSMPMHMAQQARNSIAPSIPSTPIDQSRYNTMLPSAPVPAKQDEDEGDQTMLSLPEAAMNGGFDVGLAAMNWDPNARETYQTTEQWHPAYSFS
ncbi:hypothetical protein CALVIDRAFT_565430 [Calocera viscosa TUFC12733]|uniref:Zn(2)-C6 fungal-type domain-containing protein n=1 Tax=Calocera viscosa (strain TUFC12733) TaxID=1330018 RepID=A0A167KIL9_CALVF|nr:hypothetical protein CALVIDRAFT_565430 [Calocera viscosa TUFC12733]